MLESNRVAFKEWASIVEVLGSGEQILILRKGGIHEKGLPPPAALPAGRQGRAGAGRQGKKFDVAHPEFFLFPTFEHQNPKDLKPEGQKLLEKVLAQKPDSVLPIRYYCTVEESFWIAEEKILRELEPFHLWSRECIRARYDWGEEKGLFGILVRTYVFPKILSLENLKHYGGCRSWVELEKPLATSSLKPVLPDPSFQEKKREIESLLGDAVTRLSD